MDSLVFFIMLTIFAVMVASRAAAMNRNPFIWGALAWVLSPLLIWIVLEISGRKKLQQEAETENKETEPQSLSLEEAELVQEEANA